MKKKNQISHQIVLNTIDILSEEGAAKLSMRKVSRATNISLGNLQYHYQNKNELLLETVRYYFQTCQEDVTQILKDFEKESISSSAAFLKKMLQLLLLERKSNNQIKMFQEIWALSSRDNQLESTVEAYYSDYCKWLIELVKPHCNEPEKVVSVLIPYLEGYTVVNTLLPMNKEHIIDTLVEIILKY